MPGAGESLDRRRSSSERKDDAPPSDSPPPPPPPPRRRDRDSRERRDDHRDFDRPPNRYYDRNRDRDYKRRLSPSPPPYRDRRPYSPPRRSPPYPPFKRSRREDGGYDGRRGSPRGGYGPADRRYVREFELSSWFDICSLSLKVCFLVF